MGHAAHRATGASLGLAPLQSRRAARARGLLERRGITGYEPPDWRSDVWLLTDRDEGLLIEGGRHDLFVVRLRENSSAGCMLRHRDRARGAAVLCLSADSPADHLTEPRAHKTLEAVCRGCQLGVSNTKH